MKLETIVAIVSAVVGVGGILGWFLSRLLDDRMDSKESKMEIGFLKQQIAELKKDMEKIERWYNNDRGN